MKLTKKETDIMQCISRFHTIHFWDLDKTLSQGEAMLLHYICEAEEEEFFVPVADLPEHTHMHPAGISRLMRGLEDNGLIKRTINSKDRRNTLVRTTDKGKKLNMEISRKIHAFWEDVFSRIPDKDVTELIHRMNKLADSMETSKKNRLNSSSSPVNHMDTR